MDHLVGFRLLDSGLLDFWFLVECLGIIHFNVLWLLSNRLRDFFNRLIHRPLDLRISIPLIFSLLLLGSLIVVSNILIQLLRVIDLDRSRLLCLWSRTDFMHLLR